MQKNVILLFGGNSEERMVSVASAQNLAEQFEFSELVFQDRSENLYKVSKDELFAHKNVFVNEFKPMAAPFANKLESAIDFLKNKTVFLAYHGAQGENGDVQKLFEDHKICFTGSGSKASRLAFEKNLGKEVMGNTEHKMAQEIKFFTKDIDAKFPQFEKFLSQHKKVILKPTSSGSSFGLHIIENSEQLKLACEQIKTASFPLYLMENFIKGRELTVGVTQIQDELIALPASEVVVTAGRSFDYEGKYLGSGTKEITPADLSEVELRAAQKLAIDAHLAFGCFGYSRTDMILTEEGPYFLETNTLPGLSRPSFIPQQLLAADIPIKNFINDQVWLAERRYENN